MAAVSRWFRVACLAWLALVATGCATTSTLGTSPSEADLGNDGSKAEQQRLYDEYAIEYESGQFIRSRAKGTVEGNSEKLPRASAFSNDARRYIK